MDPLAKNIEEMTPEQAYEEGYMAGKNDTHILWKWSNPQTNEQYGKWAVASNLPEDAVEAIATMVGAQIGETIAQHIKLDDLRAMTDNGGQ